MIGETLNDRYKITAELGQGGMGTVYRAHDKALNRDVAVKLMSNSKLGTEGRTRLMGEAQTIAQLNHANIVTVYDVGQYDSLPYIVMELVAGKTLRDDMPGDLSASLTVAKQIAAALAHAHEHEVVHRDVKPENVLIAVSSGKDIVKLADFGLARVYQQSKLSGLTMHGEMGGSLAYIAPEQITSFRDAQPAGDIYSVGAMLYRLLTGSYTYDFPKPFNKRVLMILQDEPVPILERKPDLRPELANVVHRALARDPEKRFRSAKVMRQALLPFARTG